MKFSTARFDVIALPDETWCDMDRRTLLSSAMLSVAASMTAFVQEARTSAPPNRGPPQPNATAVGMLFRPNHVSLRVTDLSRAMDWWQRVFGGQLVRRSKIGNIDPDAEIAFLHIADGFHIELVGGGRARAAPPPPKTIGEDYGLTGWKHVGFAVRSMDEMKAHLAAQRVTIDYEVERPDYGVRIALIREPDGYFIELYAPLS